MHGLQSFLIRYDGNKVRPQTNEHVNDFRVMISESKIDNKIRINGDAINQVQAEFAIIKNQLGEVVQQVDRLVNTNENNNTNNNNIAESIVRTANENNSLINTIETLCKGLKPMIALCNANFINHSDQPSVSKSPCSL